MGKFRIYNVDENYIPTLYEMECAVARYMDFRTNLVVPNVSWGFEVHECDLLIVTKTGYAYEVEIKRSKADLKKDIEKKHGHNSRGVYFFLLWMGSTS